MKKTSLNRKAFALFAFCFLLYLSSAIYLTAKNFYTSESLFLTEKSWIALYGPEPKLASIGLTHPSLPFILICLVSMKPFLLASKAVSCASGALLCMMMFVFACHKGVPSRWAFVLTLVFALSPLIMYAAICGEGYVHFLIIYLAITYALSNAMGDLRDRYFFSSGMILAIGYFASFETTLFAAVFLPYVLVSFKAAETKVFSHKTLAYLSTLYFPLMYALLIWVLLNWLIVHDPFFFIRSPYSLSSTISLNLYRFPELLELKSHAIASFIFLMKGILFSFPLYFVFVFACERRFLFFYLAPLIIYTIELYLGMTLIDFRKFSIFVVITAQSLFLSRNLLDRLFKWGNKAFLGASLMLAATNFVAIYGIHQFRHGTYYQRECLNTFVGPEFALWHRQIEIGQYIKEKIKEEELILLDDRLGYPIIVFSKKMKNFITPTHRFFNHYLASPFRKIDYVLVPDPWDKEGKLDLLNREYPRLYTGDEPNFTLTKDFGSWRLFRIKRSEK